MVDEDCAMRFVRHGRRGITLLEVLISIGILAIGLSSVVALVPAGRSQASRHHGSMMGATAQAASDQLDRG